MVIFVAVIFSLFRFAIPYVTHYGDTIETELSKQLNMNVSIDKVDADIQWLTPRINFIGVHIVDPDSGRRVFSLDEINLGLNWTQTIRQMKPEIGFISVVGANIDIERTAQGQFVVQGFPVQDAAGSGGGFPAQLLAFMQSSSVYLLDSRLQWRDRMNNNQYLNLAKVNVALLNDAPGHQLSINADLPASYGRHLRLVLDVEGPLEQPQSWKGKIYVGVQGLKLKRWLDDFWQLVNFNGSGLVDADLWLDWDGGDIKQVITQINANNLTLNYLDRDIRTWKLDEFAGRARWRSTARGWNLDVRDMTMERGGRSWPQAADASFVYNAVDNYVDAQSSFVRLEDLTYLGGLATSFVPLKNFDWNRMYDTYQPQGDLHKISLHVPLHAPQESIIVGSFNELGYRSDGSLPAASGLDGALSYDGKATLLHLDSRQVELDYRGLFRDKIKLRFIRGDLSLAHRDRAWHFASDDINIGTPHLTTRSRLNISIPDEGSPFIDMVTRFRKVEGMHKSLYLPAAIMPSATVAWLDSAIVNASIPDGGFLFHGKVSDYPFDHGEGMMQVLFTVQDATLQFQPDWPPLEDLSAEVEFRNRSLNIRDGRGQILGSPFSDTRVQVTDLHHARIDIEGHIQSALPRVQSFIANSPLQDILGTYLLDLQMQGDADLDLGLQIPVSTNDPVRVKGNVHFNDDDIYFPSLDYRLQKIKGLLVFDEQSVTANGIQAMVDDQPLKINFKTLHEEDASLMRIEAAGSLPSDRLLGPVPMLKKYFSGRSPWTLEIDIPLHGKERPVTVEARSDLKGISSRLPGCYGKTADMVAPFYFNLSSYPNHDLIIEVQQGQRYKIMSQRENDKWNVDVRSDDLVGHVRFMQDLTGSEPMVVYADYINMTPLLAEQDDETKDKDDKDAADEQRSTIKPQSIPPLRIQIGKLAWGDYHLSDINVETDREQDGMNIRHFEFHAPKTTVIGQGGWTQNWRLEDTTSLDFKVDSSNLGETLSRFKVTQGIEKTRGTVSAHWSWPGRPDQFDWNILKGQARVDLKDGIFKDIDAGAGRLIGILNFETLLSLDFGSQVAKGFAFDSVRGDVRFDAGNAYTGDLKVESKVAEITLDGRIGLSAKDYDQTITVVPGVGSTLTVIGAVAGGPATAAAVHLFRKLFGLDRIATYRYSVTGSWEKPKVELLSAPSDSESKGNPGNEDL